MSMRPAPEATRQSTVSAFSNVRDCAGTGKSAWDAWARDALSGALAAAPLDMADVWALGVRYGVNGLLHAGGPGRGSAPRAGAALGLSLDPNPSPGLGPLLELVAEPVPSGALGPYLSPDCRTVTTLAYRKRRNCRLLMCQRR